MNTDAYKHFIMNNPNYDYIQYIPGDEYAFGAWMIEQGFQSFVIEAYTCLVYSWYGNFNAYQRMI